MAMAIETLHCPYDSVTDSLNIERCTIGNFPTRLVQEQGLGNEIGVDLWMKHEFEADFIGSGNKARKLEFLLPQLQQEGYTGVVIDGTTQSNCAMSLNYYAPRFGLTVDLILYGTDKREGNYLDIVRSGPATITHLPQWSPPDIAASEKRILDEAATEGRRLAVIPTGATNDITALGSVRLAEELAWQEDRLLETGEMEKPIDAVVLPTASGGTQAGLEIGRLVTGRAWDVIAIGVANDEAYFKRTIGSIAAKPVIRQALGDIAPDKVQAKTYMGAMGERYGLPLPGTYEGIQNIRSRYGPIILDPLYTYKTMVGLRQLVQQGEIKQGATVVFIHTGGLNDRFVDPVDRQW